MYCKEHLLVFSPLPDLMPLLDSEGIVYESGIHLILSAAFLGYKSGVFFRILLCFYKELIQL